MLDIKVIRTNPDMVKAAMRSRNMDLDATIDAIVELDARRREVLARCESLKAEQNAASKDIPVYRRQAKDTTELMERMKQCAATVKELEAQSSEMATELRRLLCDVPNIPHESVQYGNNAIHNEELRRIGPPTYFGFEPKAHWDLGANLGILDPETAAKVTGARFHFYKGMGARLERAIINYFLDCHADSGYMEVFPPFMVNRASMTGTGQLPKFEEDAFKLTNDYFLIPTAEVPVTNMHRNEILDGSRLPIKYCAYSACFRAEAGSAGRDTRGLIRQHQFNKVELVKFADPEHSYEELESLTAAAEKVLQGLKLPYRVVRLCTGDLGFSSAKTYDIEVWMPSYGHYVEISSCSNFEDFQARRAGIRFKRTPKDKAQFVHTLNGSGVAIGRTVAAILENYQGADGSVAIPDVLIPYMGGIDRITVGNALSCERA